jgi:hypothetical protein
MPSPKLGTVTKDVVKAVKLAKAGSVKFKVEKAGIIHAAMGKSTFEKEKLLENIRAFMIALMDSKPEGFKGTFLKRAYLSTSMGPGIELEMASIDPSKQKFMLDPSLVQGTGAGATSRSSSSKPTTPTTTTTIPSSSSHFNNNNSNNSNNNNSTTTPPPSSSS